MLPFLGKLSLRNVPDMMQNPVYPASDSRENNEGKEEEDGHVSKKAARMEFSAQSIGGKWLKNPKLTDEEKKWLDENWPKFTSDGKGPPGNTKWKTINPQKDNSKENGDYELLQLAKDAARRANSVQIDQPDQQGPSASPVPSSDGSETSKKKSAIESDVPKVRARALLRAIFGKIWWSMDNDGKKTEVHKARMKWAMSVANDPTFDPLNLPIPPVSIWGTWTPKPQDNTTMLPFAGPITGIRTSGVKADGLEIVLYVKQQQEAFVIGTSDGTPALITQVFDATLMAEQSAVIVNVFKDFIIDLNEMGKKIKKVIGDDNVGKLYTGGSGRFNRTLRIPPADWKPYPDKTNSKLRLQKARDVWTLLHPNDPKAPELVTFNAFQNEGLARVHAMWRLLYIAPRITWQSIYLLRAVTSTQWLPHSLAGVADPKPGMTFLDAGFVSTTVASAQDYWAQDSQLSFFFNKYSKCCLIAIEAMPGTPMLPLFVEPSASVYQQEREVVLPPLTKWTYVGHEVRSNLNNTHVYSYRVSV